MKVQLDLESFKARVQCYQSFMYFTEFGGLDLCGIVVVDGGKIFMMKCCKIFTDFPQNLY
jgi:hypothetical protein